jgi:hypothetical protein
LFAAVAGLFDHSPKNDIGLWLHHITIVLGDAAADNHNISGEYL